MRALLADWRYRVLFAWYGLDKGQVTFFAILLLPLLVLALLIDVERDDYGRAAVARSRRDDLTCLAQNVYYEARGEPLDGQYAVAEVTMNRVGAASFPSTVCDVVHEKRWDALRGRYVGAFSWTELGRLPRPRGFAWRQAVDVAAAVYDHRSAPRALDALYYHNHDIEPSWASTKRAVATIGRHVFYR